MSMNLIDRQRSAEERRAREAALALKNKRIGVTIFQISWIMVFICLVVVNLQIRSNFPEWPPVGTQALNPLLPTLATIGLIVSGILTARGLSALRRDDRAAFMRQWQIALILGIGFIVVMAIEWVSVPFSEQYSSVFRVMTAFHALHALVIGVLMLNVRNKAQAGAYSAEDNWDVEAAAKMWYFVAIAWLLFFTVLYVV